VLPSCGSVKTASVMVGAGCSLNPGSIACNEDAAGSSPDAVVTPPGCSETVGTGGVDAVGCCPLCATG